MKSLRMLQIFQAVKPGRYACRCHGFSKKLMTYARSAWSANSLRLSPSFCPASTCLFIEGYDTCLTIDCRRRSARSVSEPEKDKVMRGSERC